MYLYSGMVAGFTCKLVEYPLDTVKVQVQTQAANGPQMSPIAMLTKSLKEEGFLGLYRGIPSPLLGSMVENSVLFASYGLATRSLHTGDPETIPFGLKLVAGGFSGACVATVLTPVELIKCKMQTTNISAVRYKSSGECLAATLKSGGIRALFHGHVGTLCRELPGNAGAGLLDTHIWGLLDTCVHVHSRFVPLFLYVRTCACFLFLFLSFSAPHFRPSSLSVALSLCARTFMGTLYSLPDFAFMLTPGVPLQHGSADTSLV